MPELKTPSEALALMGDTVTLIDIREKDEFARDRIEGAQNIPLSTFPNVPFFKGDVVVMCQSGRRTGEHNYPLFEKLTSGRIYVLEGGLNAWNAQNIRKSVV